ncbi:Down syndrome cell adhesion molecule-like protein Dscam2 [Nymphon striatum]|nr:Down syndrome cell adhesion molecule-like protein Dscam2 [Nymphon striatum]
MFLKANVIKRICICLFLVIRRSYEVSTESVPVIQGTTAVLSCKISEFALQFVKVTSWIRDDGMMILTGTVKEKYIVLPNGELLINNVDKNDDLDSFICETEDIYNKERTRSSTPARVIVSGLIRRIWHQEYHLSMELLTLKLERMPLCHAVVQGSPELIIKFVDILKNNVILPSWNTMNILLWLVFFSFSFFFRWYRKSTNSEHINEINTDDRTQIYGGSLAISGVRPKDVGLYICKASNPVNEIQAQTKLIVRQPITVNVEPKSLQADVGQSLTISCNFRGYPIKYITWMKNGKIVDPESKSERHFIISDTPGVSKLYMEPIESIDSGMYQCIVGNSQSADAAALQLTLGRMTPLLVDKFDEMTFQPGPTISLSCSAKGTPIPSIKWKLGGEDIVTQGRISVGEFVDENTGIVVSHVNISSVRVENSGYYRCIAQNDVGQVSHSAKLNVYGLPQIRKMKDRVAIASQQFFIAHCNFGGYPIENIWWTKDGMEIPNNHRQNVFENGSLVMIDLRKDIDEGKYMCTAQNKHGHTAHGIFHLTILRLPMIQPFFFMENMNADDVVQVSCSVISGDPPFEFKWFKDDKPMPWGLGVDIQSTNRYSSVLFIESLQQVHEGTYTCKVSNLAGARNYSSSLHVTVPPRWTIMPGDKKLLLGSDITIDCQVTGYPPPVIIWKLAGEDISLFTSISSNSHRQVYSNGSLSILNLTKKDSGRYLCQASNGVGNGISKVVNIEVRVPPSFLNSYEDKAVLVGSDVVLVCSVTGEQPLTVSWDLLPEEDINIQNRIRLKNEEQSNGILSTLIIFRVSMNESRNISCRAENPYGKLTKTINLQVQGILFQSLVS